MLDYLTGLWAGEMGPPHSLFQTSRHYNGRPYFGVGGKVCPILYGAIPMGREGQVGKGGMWGGDVWATAHYSEHYWSDVS